jgi:hypothetical protein
MNPQVNRSSFVVPASTLAVLLSPSLQPPFVRNSSKFLRAAYNSTRDTMVTERFDPGDAPACFNYNEYPVVATSSGGTYLSGPRPTPSTFIPNHQPRPDTWFDGLPDASTR